MPDTSDQTEQDSFFCLRERFTCVLTRSADDYVGTYRIAILSSATKALPKWGVAEFSKNSHGLQVSIKDCGDEEVARYENVSLQNLFGKNDGTYHCLLAVGTDRDVFIFLRPPIGANQQQKRRVRLEVFRKPSTHDRPGKNMIGDRFVFADDPVLPLFKGCPTPKPFVGRDDQDDEGEGYED